jgi:hypothetical protein
MQHAPVAPPLTIMKVLKKCFPMIPISYIYQKRQWGMMASFPCESTQKMLQKDTHIIYFQKRQLLMMPSDAPVTCTMRKYSKIASKLYPYHILPKKEIGLDYT